MLNNAEVIKVKRISRGGGSNTEIWKVHVNFQNTEPKDNSTKEYEHYEVYGSTGTLREQSKPNNSSISLKINNNTREWEKELTTCCMKELELGKLYFCFYYFS